MGNVGPTGVRLVYSKRPLTDGSAREVGPLDALDPENEAWDLEPGVSGAYLVTNDIVAVYASAKAAGATSTSELIEKDYGSSEFSVINPEDTLRSVGAYRSEPCPL